MTIIERNNIDRLTRHRNRNPVNYFNDLMIALLSVGDNYLIWPYGANQQMGERVFAYELYHQWRKVCDCFNYQNIVLNGEIRKDGSVLRHQSLSEIYPDLILHEQQNNMNQQLLACEIKTSRALLHSNGKKQLKKDLIKLGNYIDELNFGEVVFVQVLDLENCFEDVVVPYLIRNSNNFNNCDRIKYVIIDYEHIKYDTLENIINNVA